MRPGALPAPGLTAPPALLTALFAAILALALGLGIAPGPGTGEASAQEPGVTATTEAPVTTSTLPEGNGEIGRIIPLPNSGAEPEEPGDRGGWQQIALFIAVCLVIVGMGLFVWWRSRYLRDRRRAAGHDPVEVAREHGGDVRRPRPPGIVD